QHLLLEAPVHLLDAIAQVPVEERSLLDASGHGLFPVTDDVLVRALVLSCLLLADAPRGAGMAAAGRLPLAPAERVVDRVHGDAAPRGPDAEPAAPARLAERHVLVVDVAHLPDGRLADLVHAADLPGRQLDLHPAGVLRQQLGAVAGAAHQLT